MNDYLEYGDLYITKATHDGKVMRFAATNSDTDPDLYKERMSVELYKSFVENIKNDAPVPEPYRDAVCSDFWDGGMPYLSLSHYPDLNGDAVPGEPVQLYIEGNDEKARLKAKGILFDSPLGHAVWRSLKADKNKKPDEKIRISIGFLDLAHKHGENGDLFVRDGLTSVCSECLAGVGNKIYVNGYLVHLAFTRVPVNQRTEVVLEEKSMATKAKKTRKDDAASIVGEDLAEEIDKKSKVLRSDVLVEMSDNETETVSDETLPTSVNDAETVTENEPNSEQELVLDSVSKEPEVEKMDAANLPYGGAISLKEAQKVKKAKEEMWEVMDMFSVFQNVVWNIVDRNDVLNKKEAVSKAVDEFKSMLAAKAMVEFGMVERSDPSHPLQPAIDALLENIDNSLKLEGDLNQKLSVIDLQSLGSAITDYVTKSVNADEPAPAPNDVTETIKNLLQPLVESVSGLSERIGVLESKSTATNVQPRENRIPKPRTFINPPNLTQKSEAVKPGSLRAIMNKSVGLPENS